MGARGGIHLVALAFLVARGAAAATPLDEAWQLIKDGRYAEAEAAGRPLLAEAEAAGRGDSLATAGVLDLLVEALRQVGKEREPESLALAERGLAIRERALPADHPDIASSLATLGGLLNNTGDYVRARDLHARALAIRERALGPEHIDLAKSLNSVANSLSALGDYTGAARLHERCLAIRETALGLDHPDVARSLVGLATQLTMTGEYARAREYFERALGILERSLGPDHPDVAVCLNNFTNLLGDAGDTAGARRLSERALAIREKALGSEHPSVAMSLNNLGNKLVDAGDLAGGRRCFERAIRIWEKTLGLDHPHLGMAVDNLAGVLAKMGDLASARSLHERALALREQALGLDHPEVAKSLLNLANLLRDTREYAQADSLYARALAIREQSLGPDHPLVALILDDRAALLARMGAGPEALDVAVRGETLSRRHLRLAADAFAEREMLRYAASRTSGLGVALSVAARGGDPGRRRAAWDAVIRSRALVLDEVAARHRAAGKADTPEIAGLRDAFVAASQRLANLTVRGPDGEGAGRYRLLLEEAREERERAERALAGMSAAFRDEKARNEIGLTDVAAALPERSALVAYVRYRREGREGAAGTPPARPSYLAFVLRGMEQEPAVVPLGAAAAIDTLASRWMNEAARGILDMSRPERAVEVAYRAAGEALRRKMWDPVAAAVGDAEMVFVVPDGALHRVSLAALPGAGSGYRVETGPGFHYLSAERDLVRSWAAGRPGDGLLAVGGPDYDATSMVVAASGVVPRSTGGPWFRGGRPDCGDFRALRFEALPGAAGEAAEVAATWTAGQGEVVALTGASATEEAFKAGAAGRRVLHLATHGFFIGGECAMGGGGENPLHLSGLALAGANHRDAAAPDGEDGILTAEEIASLDLSGVQWAVLSACDTGVGEVAAGEGVLGLRRAFEVAGAGTLIMSLWAVDDESAREWMRALYERRLRDGLETARAVREASLAALRARRERGESTHPFYWGAFVAAGAWR